MKEIKYAKPCLYRHYGRNGTMKAHGISVDEFTVDLKTTEIVLEPITSRGHSTNARIVVSRDSLPELIAALIDIANKS